MLSIGIRYLTGCVTATDTADRSRAEWPPHPGRVFMAMAAAHFQTGESPPERAALEWLERLPPPELAASGRIERAIVTQYVPVNDAAGPARSPIQSAPGLTRNRQPRTFARCWPDSDTVHVVWPDAVPASDVLFALDSLCGKVTRIGHSASLVQMWVAIEAPLQPRNWIPDRTHADNMMRIAGPGTLDYLQLRFHQNPRLWPELSLSHGYTLHREDGQVLPEVPRTVFDHRLLVFQLNRIDGPYRHLDTRATLQVTTRWREALIACLAEKGVSCESMPEIISGHRGQDRSEQPHVAFLPLPFVGHEHAHGGLMGLALALPRDMEPGDRRLLLQVLGQLTELVLGQLGRWELARPDYQNPPTTLRERLWTASPHGCRRWGTVTPVVFDRHAKAKDKAAYGREVADSIRESCRRVGLDVPLEVIIMAVSPHLGAPASHEFPRLKRKDGSDCRHAHAILIFDRPVIGPVLLGAGRYRGYGLCRPLECEA